MNPPNALSLLGAQTHCTAGVGPVRALGCHSPLYLNSFSVFPRRSRTSQWELKASWGGMPQRMMAFRKAFRCRALKPSTWMAGRWEAGGERRTQGPEGRWQGRDQRKQGLRWGRTRPSPASAWLCPWAGP